eukprot:1777699-Rhodomonas_salina.1
MQARQQRSAAARIKAECASCQCLSRLSTKLLANLSQARRARGRVRVAGVCSLTVTPGYPGTCPARAGAAGRAAGLPVGPAGGSSSPSRSRKLLLVCGFTAVKL